MGFKYHIEDEGFRPLLMICLDRLSIAYHSSTREFVETFKILPKGVVEEMRRLKQCSSQYALKDYSDLVEYTREIMYYNTHINKNFKKKQKAKVYKALTLRSATTLDMFEAFLDRMNKLLTLSPGHFVELFPMCPVDLWDKVEDLRDMTIKKTQEPTQYFRCVILCKKLSFTYDAYTEDPSGKDEEN